jgi:cholesterol transport system auxiliary component
VKMRSTFVLMCVPLALSACVKFGGKPPAVLLNLTPSTMIAAGDMRSAKAGEAITIAVPMTPQALATTRVAVTDGPIAIAYIKDAVWVEPPARLFQRLLSEAVAAKTGKVVLDPRQFNVDPGVQLNGQLRSFGIDATANQAVIVYDAALTRDKGKRVETRRFEARVPVASVTPKPAGGALNKAANQIATEVAAWVSGI